MSGAPLNMEVGDAVEFLSDLQTDKGPCAGMIELIEGNNICLRISDAVEWFKRRDLQVARRSVRAKDGVTLWMFK